jgi:hypothetical protein
MNTEEKYTLSELYEQAYNFAISRSVPEAEAKQYAEDYSRRVIKLNKYDQVRD